MFSVVIPAFNEEKQIEKTISAVKDVFKNIGESCRIIVVDDGSSDGTWQILKGLAETDTAVNAVRLSRNFGKEAAIMAGLSRAGADACIIMDADLQHPPEIIPEMIALWKKGYEIVEAVKEDRGAESVANRFGASLFYKIMYRLSGFNLQNASDFKLLDAKVVKALVRMPERETFFRGLSAWVGYSRTQVYFKVPKRKHGKSGWSRVKLFRLAVTAFTSFSSLPLQFVTLIGIVFLVGSLILGIQTLVMKFRGLAVDGFTTVILLHLITGSCLMISLGMIGTYVARIYNEVKARPRYIVSEEYGRQEKDCSDAQGLWRTGDK